MIHLLSHDGDTMAQYQGRLVRSRPGKPGSDCVVLDGVSVSKNDLDALFFEEMRFDWKGETFKLGRYVDGRVSGRLMNFNSAWASARDEITGDCNTGLGGWFPESEIENLRVARADLLAAWRHKKQVGTTPPAGRYTYERPATSREWVKD
jgi:hypothetical protein